MVTSPSDVQLPDDGTGKYVRTFALTQYDDTGTEFTAQIQAVGLADASGNLVDLGRLPTLLEEVLRVNKQTLQVLALIASAVSNTNVTVADLGA